MRRVVPAEIHGFLREVDARLTQPTRLVVIGGAAVALGWDEHHATPDIDTWNHPGPLFQQAVEACAGLPGAIPIDRVTVASPPYNFEDRLVPVPIEGLQHLQVYIPEAHDLALMKIVRGEAHDFAAVEDMHRVCPLELDTLVSRYGETLSTLIGPATRLRTSFLALVARLYGEDRAEALDRTLSP